MNISEIIKNQPIMNIGVIGHVANGKSTLIRNISGEKTQRYASEQEKNITIKLGYSNAKIWKCNECEAPACYQSTSSSVYNYECKICGKECDLKTHISFVDTPGHHVLIGTMLKGTSVMDYAIVVESITNESMPEKQTQEHMQIINQCGKEVKYICMNKIDVLIKKDIKGIKSRMNELEKKLNIPVIPITGTHGINIDVVLEQLCNLEVNHNYQDTFKMIITRSFNINKPGIKLQDLKGSVIGGSIINGSINEEDEVIILPFRVENNVCHPLKTKIKNIKSGDVELKNAISGGLIGIETCLDSSLGKNDGLAGNIVFKYEDYVNKKLDIGIYKNIEVCIDNFDMKNKKFIVNTNSQSVLGKIISYENNILNIELEKELCLSSDDKIILSSDNKNSFVNYGLCKFINGKKIDIHL